MQCVPLILLSALVFFTYAPVAYPAVRDPIMSVIKSVPQAAALVPVGLNYGLFIALGYCGYYLYLAPSALGLSAAVLVTGLYLGAQQWRVSLPDPLAWQSALALHLVGWIAQFWAHAVHEGRSPALLDNLAQALFMAPLFVYMEVLFDLGLLKGFKAEVAPLVAKRVAAWKASKKA